MDPAKLARLADALDGRYRVERELGEGGMATVTLAWDLRHDRPVALKVLKPELAATLGTDRFLAEIRVTARLQHPHILPLFDSGVADGFVFYVMPYVEGESLRARLDREKQLPIEQAVRIASAVGEALDHAHRQGVIHRDIKPENVLLRDGQPMVADFGIALALHAASQERFTQTGFAPGTPRYMSPEQLTSERDAGPASDVYALGCVAYEMLAGVPPFTGASHQVLLGRVLSGRPASLSELRPTVPAYVDAAILKSIERLPADRFATAGEFAQALTRESAAAGRPLAPGPRRMPKRDRAASLAVAAVAVLLALNAWLLLQRRQARGPTVYDVGIADAPIIFTAQPLPALSVSQSGAFVVYVAQQGADTELWYRSLLDDEARPIAGTRGASTPMLSRDGLRVAFIADGQLKVAPVAGGTVSRVTSVADPAGARWLDDDRILIADHDGQILRWIDPGSGRADSARAPHCLLPQPLPPQSLLCSGAFTRAEVLDRAGDGYVARTLPSRAPALMTLAGSDFRLLDDNHIAFVSAEGVLRVVRFQPATLEIGSPVATVDNVRFESYTGAGQYAVAASGTLVYAPGPTANIGHFVRTRVTGETDTLEVPAGAWERFGLSRTGQRFAAVQQDADRERLLVFDLASGRQQTLLEAAFIGEPFWLPDDRVLVSVPSSDGVPNLIIDSPGNPRADTLLRGVMFLPTSATTDGRIVAWEPGSLIGVVIDPAQQPVSVDTVLTGVYFPAIAPNGKWMAYQLASTGQLSVERWPERDRRYELAAGGWEPQWLDSITVGFWKRSTWYIGKLRPDGEGFDVSMWFSDPRFSDTLGQSWEPTGDGHAIYLRGPADITAAYLRVVPGWLEDARRAARLAR